LLKQNYLGFNCAFVRRKRRCGEICLAVVKIWFALFDWQLAVGSPKMTLF
jgi:hypothetical protein